MQILQELRMRTAYMMEEMRRRAIDETLEKFKVAARHYYETSEGGADTTKYIKELEELGVNMECIIEIDLQIRDEVCGA